MQKKQNTDNELNKENNVVVANEIIYGKQSNTLQAARLIRLMVSQVAKDDTCMRRRKFHISELVSLLGVSNSNLYRDIKDICETLQRSFVSIQTGNPKEPWKNISWVSESEYDGQGTVTITLSETIAPYLLALSKSFTQYKVKNILSFRSFYAIRFYEIIQCRDGAAYNTSDEVSFSIEELRTYVGCENKYPSFRDFRKRVIEYAVADINKLSDIFVEVEYIRTGKTVTDVVFKIRANPDKNNPNSPYFQAGEHLT